MDWTDKDDPWFVSARLYRFNQYHTAWDEVAQRRRHLPEWADQREKEVWDQITETPVLMCGD